eukprot:COSAG04_NODE_12101_length_670_cov_1.162872_2_plen_43_part_01
MGVQRIPSGLWRLNAPPFHVQTILYFAVGGTPGLLSMKTVPVS